MTLQVLVATMHQNDFAKVEEMNLHSDCIFANQAGRMSYCEKEFPFGTAKMVTTNTIGVGANRNLALFYADADYLLFADDDLRYTDHYSEVVLQAFKEIPQADGLIFNVDSTSPNHKRRINHSSKRLRFYNAMAYGAVRVAVKRTAILRENIMFSLNFGGGSPFSSGEDSLFIMDMLRHGLKLYTYPAVIATVDDAPEKSSWFRGYNEKYYYDQGIITKALHRFCPKIMCLQFLIRHPNYRKSHLSFSQAYGLMKQGMASYHSLTPFQQNPCMQNCTGKKHR